MALDRETVNVFFLLLFLQNWARSLSLRCTLPQIIRKGKKSLKIQFLGRMFLGHPGPRCRDILDKAFMRVAFFCCLDREWPGCPGFEKLYAGKLWADFSFHK